MDQHRSEDARRTLHSKKFCETRTCARQNKPYVSDLQNPIHPDPREEHQARLQMDETTCKERESSIKYRAGLGRCYEEFLILDTFDLSYCGQLRPCSLRTQTHVSGQIWPDPVLLLHPVDSLQRLCVVVQPRASCSREVLGSGKTKLCAEL
jgi:hypothetical protein